MELNNTATKLEFDLIMETAIATNSNYVVLFMKMPGLPEPEIIINSRANFELKQQYIDDTYDDKMNHKYSDGVSIVDYMICDNLSDIAKPLQQKIYPTHNLIH